MTCSFNLNAIGLGYYSNNEYNIGKRETKYCAAIKCDEGWSGGRFFNILFFFF